MTALVTPARSIGAPPADVPGATSDNAATLLERRSTTDDSDRQRQDRDASAHGFVSRRAVLQTDAATGAVLAAGMPASVDAATAPLPLLPDATALGPVVMQRVSVTVNGQPRVLTLDARTTLLDALREHLRLT